MARAWESFGDSGQRYRDAPGPGLPMGIEIEAYTIRIWQ